MKCPVCPESTLVMSDRQGIEIDYCPKCRGIWLDRGELDKLLERSVRQETPSAARTNAGPREGAHRSYDDDDREYPRRKSWLSEIFD